MAYLVTVKGIVQGVGFRPHIFRKATGAGFSGWVTNEPGGVRIFLEIEPEAIDHALRELLSELPGAAKVDQVITKEVPSQNLFDFSIRDSIQEGSKTTEISPDLSICNDCREEVLDVTNRRYKYPYINCTNCGPRYSVIEALPYDRKNTTMAPWPLCKACDDEYLDPFNRRFHAEPIACWECGPRYRIFKARDSSFSEIETSADPTQVAKIAAQALREGNIVAIKGIGGYHLACDAMNVNILKELRSRKFRRDKPFALMANEIETLQGITQLTTVEKKLLLSTCAPVVLVEVSLDPKGTISFPLEEIAPNLNEIGVMLAHTPFQVLLFEEGAPNLLVMTSGNRSSEPIYYRDDEALSRLIDLADYVCVGERPIARRLDDSVVRADKTLETSFVRRSRGYSPAFVAEVPTSKTILACGADLKSTVALAVDQKIMVSPFLGDLEYFEVYESHRRVVKDLISLYCLDPSEIVIACDKHPEYFSTKLAHEYCDLFGIGEPVSVQHHRAHVASVLLETATIESRAVGIALDGTGYGDDGTIWGGEFFVGSLLEGLQRVGSIAPAKLLGGEAAAKRPLQALGGFLKDDETWRDARSFIHQSDIETYKEISDLRASAIKAISTTSTGRLFDAMAAICGFNGAMTYEGQAAMWLEALADKGRRTLGSSIATLGLSFDVVSNDFLVLEYEGGLKEAIEMRRRGVTPEKIAYLFHLGLANGLAELSENICQKQSLDQVVLSGGVFQNQMLCELMVAKFSSKGIKTLRNHKVSCNDESISLGQIAYCGASVIPRHSTDIGCRT